MSFFDLSNKFENNRLRVAETVAQAELPASVILTVMEARFQQRLPGC